MGPYCPSKASTGVAKDADKGTYAAILLNVECNMGKNEF
jgi:hypothetical protein